MIVEKLGKLYHLRTMPGSPIYLAYEIDVNNIIVAGPFYVPKWAV